LIVGFVINCWHYHPQPFILTIC